VTYLDFIIFNILYFAIPKDNNSIKSIKDTSYQQMADDNKPESDRCPVFGVRSGGPVIGLGILILLFGIIPLFIKGMQLPVPVALVFIGFGVFLVWAGLSQ